MIQISENAAKLPKVLKEENSSIPWVKISGLRNRIVHDYGSVDYSIVYETVVKDLPYLLELLMELQDRL